MFTKVVSTVFNGAVVVVAAAAAVWLTVTGHTLHIGGLLLMLGSVLAAVIFAFKLVDDLGSGRVSIYAGPLSSVRPRIPSPSGALRRAA